ncbi:DUF4065 domain-containing protein [Listeria booriae]|uniref:Panacea domain-containing protein n=1 Tax=Listeria booriae TaxID=1552123 RepID=UPI001628745C|nr:type II toxin-antitoxin system antitoxin SocA domain-containing protein [Listeria booriae]MBC2180181.1 DUF4065 domain-containing protein [Listeria booriae]
MKDVKTLARYLIYSYENYTKSIFEPSELKLQKLMYFAQRQSLALTGEPLFENEIQGWVHGPVVTELRHFLEEGYTPYQNEAISETDKYILDNVVNTYGKFEAWSLRDMSHAETSWKKSREGLADNQYGSNTIAIDDIRKDAEGVRIFDHQYDMYIDEFEDFDDEVL